MANDMRAVSFQVHGTVQGVGFRMFTQRHAMARGIAGWVRNLPDGSVEGWLEGEDDSLNEMIDLLRAGPSTGFVSSIQMTWPEVAGYHEFEIRR